MKIGYFGLNQGLFCEPDAMVRLVRVVEDAGYESIWTGEHVVLIDPPRSRRLPFRPRRRCSTLWRLSRSRQRTVSA